jgi:molybdopterin-guanine dinucleotide biosynthesis protein A
MVLPVPTYDAILPAGGKISPELARRVGTDVKALIQIEGRTILASTLEALRGSQFVGRSVVIGGSEVQKAARHTADVVLPETASGPENILSGLKYLLGTDTPPQKVIVITTDLPFLTSEIINTFVGMCPPDRNICVPLVNRTDWDKRFPDSTATFATLKDGSWTTGCAYLIDGGALRAAMPQLERVFEYRKSVVKMARLLGPKFLFKFLTKTLTVPDVEEKIQSMLGCTGAAIRHAPTELAYDIDDLEDYDYAIGLINRK